MKYKKTKKIKNRRLLKVNKLLYKPNHSIVEKYDFDKLPSKELETINNAYPNGWLNSLATIENNNKEITKRMKNRLKKKSILKTKLIISNPDSVDWNFLGNKYLEAFKCLGD